MNFENLKDMKEFCKYNKIDVANLLWDTCEKSQEKIEALKAENERLTKQLENPVRLPCKVGGVIYWVTKGNDFECREFYYIEEGIVEWVMKDTGGTYWVYVKYNSGLTYQHHIEKTTQEDNLYQSLSEAEARLKELSKEGI